MFYPEAEVMLDSIKLVTEALRTKGMGMTLLVPRVPDHKLRGETAVALNDKIPKWRPVTTKRDIGDIGDGSGKDVLGVLFGVSWLADSPNLLKELVGKISAGIPFLIFVDRDSQRSVWNELQGLERVELLPDRNGGPCPKRLAVCDFLSQSVPICLIVSWVVTVFLWILATRESEVAFITNAVLAACGGPSISGLLVKKRKGIAAFVDRVCKRMLCKSNDALKVGRRKTGPVRGSFVYRELHWFVGAFVCISVCAILVAAPGTANVSVHAPRDFPTTRDNLMVRMRPVGFHGVAGGDRTSLSPFDSTGASVGTVNMGVLEMRVLVEVFDRSRPSQVLVGTSVYISPFVRSGLWVKEINF